MQAEPDEPLLRVAGEAAGNPFLLVELLEGLRQEGLVRVDAGHATLTEDRLPDRVSTSMRERLARMSASARQVATVAGSLGRAFSVSDLGTMLGLRPAAVLASVEELMEAGIVTERGEQLSFQHDLIREAVRQACPPSARRALDRQAADVMLARGALPVEVATQLAASAEAGRRGRDHDSPGGRRGANDDRSGSERRPQPTGSGAGPRKASFTCCARRASGDVAPRSGSDRRSEGVCGQPNEGGTAGGGRGGGASGYRRHVVGVPRREGARSRVALKLEGLSEQLRLAHMAKLAYNLVAGGRTEEAQVRYSEAVAVGGRLDRVARFPLALSEGGLHYMGGDFAHALELFEAVLRDGVAEAHGLDEFLTRLWRSIALLALDRAEDGLEAIDGIIAESLKRGFSWFLHVAELTRGTNAFAGGSPRGCLCALGRAVRPRGAGGLDLDGRFGVAARASWRFTQVTCGRFARRQRSQLRC